MKKLYIDHSNEGDGPIGIFVRDTEVVYTGTMINSAPAKMRNEPIIQKGADCGIYFFFDDENIQLNLYTVPFMEAFARDGAGGVFAKPSEDDAPVFYFNAALQPFQVAKNLQAFINDMSAWREHLLPDQMVEAYASRMNAQRVHEIHDLNDLLAQ